MSGISRIEVLAIGDELLDGRVADTNTLRLAKALSDVGSKIRQRTTVIDDIDDIVREAKAIAARGTELCVVSGGLGPTSDDVTSDAFAALLGVSLVRDEALVAALEARFQKRGFVITDNQRAQADRPEGSELLPNHRGTAPGFAVTFEGCRFVCVPGVPSEYDAMIEASVIAALREGATPRLRKVLGIFGLIEGDVDRRLEGLAERFSLVRVGYRAHVPEIHVSLSAPQGEEVQLDEAVAFVRQQLGIAVFSERGESLPEALLAMLRERGHTLAAAESCTGGLIGDYLTNIPGSSDVFLGSVVSYANGAKENLLGVSAESLERDGAVSESVVVQMAKGVQERLGSTYALAVSGIAGPGGGTADKPVGTVWMALFADGAPRSKMISLPFDRRRNKQVSAYAALDMLRRHLERTA